MMLICVCMSRRAVAQVATGQSVRSEQAKNTEAFLTRLKLPGLQIRLLENELKKTEKNEDELNQEARQAVAGRLLRMYATRMMAADPASERWFEKTKALLISHPALSTPSIRIAMSQAAYLENENRFQRWRAEGSRLDRMPPLNRGWQNSIDDLQRVQRDLDQTYSDQLTIVQATGDNTVAMSNRLTQLESEIAHTDYLLGWTRYFSGVLNPQQRRKEFQQANVHFRRFLQIDPQMVLVQLEKKWIDFDSAYQTRALAGLAMCQRGLEHPDQSEHCFQLIRSSTNDPSTIDLVSRWKLNSRIYINDLVGLDPLIETMINDKQISKSGRARFWMEVWSGAKSLDGRVPLVAQRLRHAATTGLARELQANRLVELMQDENGFDTEPATLISDPYILAWVRGYLAFDAATRGPQETQAKSFEVAKIELNKALGLLIQNPTGPKIDQLIIRFLCLQTELGLHQSISIAPQLLELADEFERQKHRELAAYSQWLAIGALSEASRSEHSRSVVAIREIDQLTRRFPNSPYHRQAEFLRAKLVNLNLPHDQAINRLSQFSVDHPSNIAAKLEIVRHSYLQWQSAHRRGNQDLEETSWEQLTSAVEAVLTAESADEGDRMDARLRLAGAKVLRSASTQDDIIATLDSIGDTLEGSLDDSTTAKLQSDLASRSQAFAKELRLHRFHAALRFSDYQAAQTHMAWLGAHANGSPSHRSAVIEMARSLDERITGLGKTKSNDTERQSLLNRAQSVFSELVDLLGIADNDLSNSSNARVAFARLAELKLELGQAEQSAAMASRLVEMFPKRKNYRLVLARSLQQSKQMEAALPHWRLLTSAAAAGSQEWYESKLAIVECMHAGGETESASKLLKQTLLLSPEIPAQWQNRVSELQAEINRSPGRLQER